MELPEELMTLILSKVPAKSLLRFKCVQKSWYSLINSPYFINLQRSSSINKNDCFIVPRHFPERPRLERDVLSLHSYETLDEELGSQINIPFSFLGYLRLCSSCDGLVCLANSENDTILICNPTIREFRSLFVPPSFHVSCDYCTDSIALGYNPNTGQYTLVVIGVSIPGFGYNDYYWIDEDISKDREARLYDFSTDSWREAAVVIPGPFDYSHRAISLNGAFHWCPDRDNILTLHMSNEVTGFIPLPDFAQVTHSKELYVSTKSQLSLVLYDKEERRFEICVMTEYGVNDSWTRLFNIGPLRPNIYEPMLLFWDEQRVLLRSAAPLKQHLVSCDHQHKNLRHFPIDWNFDLYPFSQSLVSVNGIGKSII